MTHDVLNKLVTIKETCKDVELKELAENAIQEIQRLRLLEQDAARFAFLRSNAKEKLLNPGGSNAEFFVDFRTKWDLPVLICSGPVGGFIDFNDAVDNLMERENNGSTI